MNNENVADECTPEELIFQFNYKTNVNGKDILIFVTFLFNNKNIKIIIVRVLIMFGTVY